MKQIIIIVGFTVLGVAIYGLILNPSGSIREASGHVMMQQVEVLNQN